MGPYRLSPTRVRGGDTGQAQAPCAVGVPLSGCGLSLQANDPERQSRSKGNAGYQEVLSLNRPTAVTSQERSAYTNAPQSYE